MFNQILNPTGNLGLTLLASLVPVIVLLFLLAVMRMTAWLATLIAGIVTIVIGCTIWDAPFSIAPASAAARVRNPVGFTAIIY